MGMSSGPQRAIAEAYDACDYSKAVRLILAAGNRANKFIEEKVYDGSTVSALELAASVYSTVGDITHEAVTKSAGTS